MAAINPNYEKKYKYQNNCYSCTTAYVLRRKGYDVKAIPDSDGEVQEKYLKSLGVTDSYLSNSMNHGQSARLEDCVYSHNPSETYQKTINFCKKMESDLPDGSYGYFDHSFAIPTSDSSQIYAGGHSIAFSKENGKLYLLDCQSNKKYTWEEYMQSIENQGGYVCHADYTRMDNFEVPPNVNVEKYVANEDEDDTVNELKDLAVQVPKIIMSETIKSFTSPMILTIASAIDRLIKAL